jgi:hypothetical protein
VGSNLKTADFVPTANETTWSLPFKTQSDYQWSLSLQQALGANTALELNYIGSSSVNLFSTVESNFAQYLPGQSTIANTQARRLYPQFGQINNTLSAFSSNYNAMQVVINRHYAKGFSVLGSYTWSKALGVNVSNGEGSNGPRNPYNYQADYGLLSLDRKHNFIVSALWEVPFGTASAPKWQRYTIGGWQLSGIANMVSGAPLTVRAGRDNSLSGIGGDTADTVGDWHLPDGRSRQEQMTAWFNTASFAQNAPGTFGTTGIGILRGPGSWNTDLALQRQFRFTERQRLEFRASFYNLFNHANLNNPDTTQLNTTTFGKITAVSAPRVIEFGLRFAF